MAVSRFAWEHECFLVCVTSAVIHIGIKKVSIVGAFNQTQIHLFDQTVTFTLF